MDNKILSFYVILTKEIDTIKAKNSVIFSHDDKKKI